MIKKQTQSSPYLDDKLGLLSSMATNARRRTMFRPASLFIALRYTREKRRTRFVSFISLISMMGIALGVMVLITVLSVMNGFDKEIRSRVFSMVPPITVSSMNGYVSDWRQLQKQLDNLPYVTASAPFVTGEVLLSSS